MRDKEDKVKDDLYELRHSLAHVLAQAVLQVRPGAKLAFGPPIDNGFYYDFDFTDGGPLALDDLEDVEERMRKILKEDQKFERRDLTAADAETTLSDRGETYKVEHCRRLAAAGNATVSFYKNGPFEDLCEGPHVESTRRIKHNVFKLDRIAGAYWLGDETQPMLSRIYGLAFRSKEELVDYVEKRKQAMERDHRVLGRKLQLFHIDEDVGQGLILWTPNGAVIRTELQKFITEELLKQGYSSVFTPHIGKLDLYRTSGHFPYYAESQYPPIVPRDVMEELVAQGCTCGELANRVAAVGPDAIDGYLLKPMNCPHHIKIYASQQRSYRDLPVRLAEFGMVYRWEKAGELGGMTRVRGFTQDDAHLFCMEEQLPAEIEGCLSIVKTIFGKLGMRDYRVRVGLRDPDSSKYTGDAANWDKAETACRAAAATLGVPFSEEAGEAAFYGPKIDFVVKDVLGREWQLGTVQVDYNLPLRFNLSYIGADNQPHRPVMVHRAPFGSMERFVGVLIEHYGGAFPTWLSPLQARVVPVGEKFADYAHELAAALKSNLFRVDVDASSDSFNKRLRNAITQKIPNILVVGAKEQEERAVAWRRYGQEKQTTLPFAAFTEVLTRMVAQRTMDNVADADLPLES
ncbi:MAG: threonine--tRNA ligase [Planctomycetia bacterium]